MKFSNNVLRAKVVSQAAPRFGGKKPKKTIAGAQGAKFGGAKPAVKGA